MVFTLLRYRICGKNVPWRTAGNGYFVLCFRVFAVQELCQKRTMTCCGKRVFRTAFLRFCGTEFAQEADGFVLQRPGCGGPKLVHNGAKSGQSRVPKWAISGPEPHRNSMCLPAWLRNGPKVGLEWTRSGSQSGPRVGRTAPEVLSVFQRNFAGRLEHFGACVPRHGAVQ